MNLTLFNFMAYRRVNNTHKKKDDCGRITIDGRLAASAVGKIRRGRYVSRCVNTDFYPHSPRGERREGAPV